MLELLQTNRMQLMALIIVLECLLLFVSIKFYRRYKEKHKGEEDGGSFEGSTVWTVVSLIITFVLLYRDVYKGKEWISSSFLLAALIFAFSISILLFVAGKYLVWKEEYGAPPEINQAKTTQKEIKRQEAEWKKQAKLR